MMLQLGSESLPLCVLSGSKRMKVANIDSDFSRFIKEKIILCPLGLKGWLPLKAKVLILVRSSHSSWVCT